MLMIAPLSITVSASPVDSKYSGDVENPTFDKDPTPENILSRGELEVEWSLMSTREISFASSRGMIPRFVYSIEELSTVDFKHIPSTPSG